VGVVLTENKEIIRKLTPDEERLSDELNLSKWLFAGGPPKGYVGPSGAPYRLLVPDRLDPALPVIKQVKALEFEANYRFGNLMQQLTNSFWLAKSLGIADVVIPRNPVLRTRFEIEGVRFSQKAVGSSTHSDEIRIEGGFFYIEVFAHLLPERDTIRQSMAIFGPSLQYIPKFHFIELGKFIHARFMAANKVLRRDLTIHIRSGDIFDRNPHPEYWQPPYSFYRNLITSTKPWQVTMVFEDRGNPVIDELEGFLRRSKIRLRIVDGPIEAAFREVITARRLAVSRGSFAVPMVAIGNNLKELFVFGASYPYDAISRLTTKKFSIVRVRDPHDQYKSKVSPWRNSQDQRESMLSHDSDGFPTLE